MEATALTKLPAGARQTTFEDESIKKSDIDNYKPKEGATDRITVLDPDLCVVARSHYGGEGVGYILCQSIYKRSESGAETLERRASCCEHLPEADLRIAVPILRYDTKANGELVKPLSFTFLVWRINEEKFSQLRGIHKEWGLKNHDLVVNCTDEKYQKLTIQLAKDRVIGNPEVMKKFGAEIEGFLSTISPKLVRAIGKEVTEQALLEKMGKVSAVSTVKTVDAPVGDIKDLLG